MDNTKLTEKIDPQMCNDSVTPKKYKEKARDDFNDEETTKDSKSPSDQKEEEKEKLVVPIYLKEKYLNNKSIHRR